jgi:hypothetical protein
VVLPQAATGIASTAIFCLIFAWNEYAFAVLLTSATAQTAPPFIPTIIGIGIGIGGLDWPAVAAETTIFLLPAVIFHHRFAQTPAAGDHLRSCPQMNAFLKGMARFRRGSWETVATILIALGAFMLMQPLALWMYTYSFIVTLVDTVMFIVVNHFSE